ncbi:MAG: DUF3054 domain-containing protein [Acidimicrobiia bacterium]
MTSHPDGSVAPAARRPRFDRGAVGPLLADWVCVAIFVFLGKENHGYEQGVTWFLTVWWPLAVGVLVGGLVMRIYTDDTEWPGRLFATVAIAVVVGGPLRWTTGRPVYSVFTVVAVFVLSLLLFGWRIAWRAWRRHRDTVGAHA